MEKQNKKNQTKNKSSVSYKEIFNRESAENDKVQRLSEDDPNRSYKTDYDYSEN